MNTDYVSLAIFALFVSVILIIYRIIIGKLNKKVTNFQNEQRENEFKVAKGIADLIIANKVFSGKNGSVSFSVHCDVLHISIGNQDIFEILKNYDKYVPMVLVHIRNAINLEKPNNSNH